MKTKLLFLIFLFFSISQIIAQTTGSTGWFCQYPKPQGNTLQDIYVLNKDTAIAIGDFGTVIKTTDGGISWDVKYNLGGNYYLLNVFFLNNNTGWIVGEKKIFKTTDAGENWSIYRTDSLYGFNCIYFIDNDTGWVFGSGLIMKTVDGGKNWTNYFISSLDDKPSLSSVAFIDGQTGFVVGNGFYGNEIYKTTDGGSSWIQLTNFDNTVYGAREIKFIDRKTGFIVSGLGIFLKTTDGGNTWKYHDLNQDGKSFDLQSVFFTDSLTGWIAGNGTIGDYDYGDIILKTTDGGDSWTIVDSNKIGINNNVAQLYKVRFSDKSNGWIVGQFGVIYRTTDAGNNWILQREDKHTFNSVYFVDENTGWAVGGLAGWSERDSGIILHTTNGGMNWERQIVSNDLVLNSVYAFDNQNIIAVGEEVKGTWGTFTYNVAILQTTNGGQTWERNLIDTIGAFRSVCFATRKIGWVVGGQILRTSDGGVTWNEQNNPSNRSIGRVQFIDENTGWIGVGGSQSDNSLYKTTNGGNTWVSQVIDTNITLYSFYFINSNIGWAVGEYNQGKGIYKTTDGGSIWFQCNNPIPNGSYSSVYFINEFTGWAVGANSSTGKMIKTTDGGDTWYEQKCPTTDALSNVFVLNDNIGWVTGNGIFKTIDGGGIASVKEMAKNGNLPKQIILNQNYPNPFNPSTIISWQLISNSHVILKVYDILGREIATLVNKDLSTGSHSINWDASKMASGVYFYRLNVQSLNSQKDGSFIETKKMILLR